MKIQIEQLDLLGPWPQLALREGHHEMSVARPDVALREWEAEFGVITQEDMDAAYREAKRRAVVVRGSRANEPRRKYGR